MSPGKKGVIDTRGIVLRKIILAKLRSIQKEKFEPKTIDKFSLTFRVFLLRYLNLNYEFTLDELINELNKKKVPSKLKNWIIEIMNLLTEMEYEDKKISREEFKSLLKEAEGVINLATGEVEEKEETIKKEKEKVKAKKRVLFNFLHKIGLVKTEEERKAIEKVRLKKRKESQKLKEIRKQEELRAKEERKRQIETEKRTKELEFKKAEEEESRKRILEEEKKRKQIEEWKRKKLDLFKRKEPVILPPPLPFPDIEALSLEELEKKKGKIELIKKKLHKARIMLNESKLNDVKRIYIGIMKIYISLEPTDQVEVYNDIKKLYFERKSKEKVKRIKNIK